MAAAQVTENHGDERYIAAENHSFNERYIHQFQPESTHKIP